MIHTLYQGDGFLKNPKFGEMVQQVELVSTHTTFTWWKLYQGPLERPPQWSSVTILTKNGSSGYNG